VITLTTVAVNDDENVSDLTSTSAVHAWPIAIYMRGGQVSIYLAQFHYHSIAVQMCPDNFNGPLSSSSPSHHALDMIQYLYIAVY